MRFLFRNGPIYLFVFLGDNWKLIGELEGNWIGPMKYHQTNSYQNLVVNMTKSHCYEPLNDGMISMLGKERDMINKYSRLWTKDTKSAWSF